MGKYIFRILAFLPALYLFVSWHTFERRGELGVGADGITYVWTSRLISSVIESSSSVLDWIYSAYEVRVWKGLILPQIYLPFQLLLQNDTYALFLFKFSFLVLFTIYLYLIFSKSTSALKATLATILITTIPWLINSSFFFDSYFTFITAMLVACYHLYLSNYFSKTKHVFIFSAAVVLAACLRPVELVLIFIGPLSAYLFVCNRVAKTFGLRDFLALAYLVLVPIAFGLYISWFEIDYPRSFQTFLFLIPMQLLPLIYIKKLQLNRIPTLAFSISSILIAVWWMPFSRALWNWAQTASVGAVSNHFPRAAEMGTLQFVAATYARLGSIGLYVLMAAAAMNWFFRLEKLNLEKKAYLFSYCYLAIAPPFFLSQFPTFNLNYSIVPFAFIWVGTILLVLEIKNKWVSSLLFLGSVALSFIQFEFVRARIENSILTRPGVFLNFHLSPSAMNVAGDSPVGLIVKQLTSILSPFHSNAKEFASVFIVTKKGERSMARVFPCEFSFFSYQQRLPWDFRSALDETLKARHCSEDTKCIAEVLRDSQFVLVEINQSYGIDSEELAKGIFAYSDDCRLESIGLIDSLKIANSTWLGYSVYRKVCGHSDRKPKKRTIPIIKAKYSFAADNFGLW